MWEIFFFSCLNTFFKVKNCVHLLVRASHCTLDCSFLLMRSLIENTVLSIFLALKWFPSQWLNAWVLFPFNCPLGINKLLLIIDYTVINMVVGKAVSTRDLVFGKCTDCLLCSIQLCPVCGSPEICDPFSFFIFLTLKLM